MCLLIRIPICRIQVGTTLVLDLHELVSKVLLLKSNASSTMHRFLEPPVYFGLVERPWYNCLAKIVSCKLSSCSILNRHIVSACVYSAIFEYSMWDCWECLLVELIYILGYNSYTITRPYRVSCYPILSRYSSTCTSCVLQVLVGT